MLRALILVPILAVQVLAQSAPLQTFEAAAVSVNTTSAARGMRGGTPRSGRYELLNATLVDLIRTAYSVDADRVVGGPHWLDLDRFDVIAKVPQNATRESVRPLLQNLLADRFKLVIRVDTPTLPVYALTLDSDLHSLRGSTAVTPSCRAQPRPGSVIMSVACSGLTMGAFADLLPQMSGGYITTRVIDATALKGGWDFELTWTPLQALAQAGAEGVPITRALERLGLRLQHRDMALAALVVDSVNRQPTPNAADVTARIPALPEPEFATAEIAPSPPGAQVSTRILPNGEVRATGTPMKTLIAVGWDFPNEPMIIGPKWIDDTRFDLTASVSGGADVQPADNVTIQQMVKKLLAARFRAAAHVESRPMSVSTLVSTGPHRLTKADPAARTTCFEGPRPGVPDSRLENRALTRLTTCENITLGEFADRLQVIGSGYLQMPAADATGIDGRWTITLAFSPPALVQANVPGALTLQQAIEQQLGLKLEMRERPVPVLVVDTIEQEPSVK